ncbi:MAG: AraC family transcriptional regulator [Verrucomicrobiota bacterium]
MLYRFRGKTIKTWVHFIPEEDLDGNVVRIPIMQDLGAEFERLRGELQMVSSLYRSQPERAVARLWDILWHLVPMEAAEPVAEPSRHPLVARAMDEIDMHLSETIEVESLATELGVSQTHLNRLFKAATRTTVGHYIRGRRLESAMHLLTHTTIPIKGIAWQVGIPDAQHFNKFIRAHFGQSPRSLRASSR